MKVRAIIAYFKINLESAEQSLYDSASTVSPKRVPIYLCNFSRYQICRGESALPDTGYINNGKYTQKNLEKRESAMVVSPLSNVSLELWHLAAREHL